MINVCSIRILLIAISSIRLRTGDVYQCFTKLLMDFNLLVDGIESQ